MQRQRDFTPRVRRVLYFAREEAARLHHDYLGTEHLLLGLIREGEGIAAKVLMEHGLDRKRIREETDSGKPTVVADPDSRIAHIYREIARRTAAKLSLKTKDYAARFPQIVIQND